MRVEIEIALEKLYGLPFRGTVNPVEAKHGIYGQCLSFENFDNFKGVYKGGAMLIFRLKSAIIVEKLLPTQHFDYTRKSSRRGITHVV